MEEKNIAIGFVTGRKSFRNVLKTYAYHWKGLIHEYPLRVHLIAAYDLNYQHTNISDYVHIQKDVRDIFQSVTFLGPNDIEQMKKNTAAQLTRSEADLLFENGYAGKRNAVLYKAIQNHMDALVFLDDDEYPLAVTNRHGTALWSGQNVFVEHLKNLETNDITNGYHCGYISPIPIIPYSDDFTKEDFRVFINSLQNDALHWETIRKLNRTGGVTYAEINVLRNPKVFGLAENKSDKLPITGSNLGINLTNPLRTVPFFNPKGARGEDTFFGFALKGKNVVRIPAYTFHDGFQMYPWLLNGVLPIHLKEIHLSDPGAGERFYKACIGWFRYKPLYLLLTDSSHYQEEAEKIRTILGHLTPKMENYFHLPFTQLVREFTRYSHRVEKDAERYEETQEVWQKLMQIG